MLYGLIGLYLIYLSLNFDYKNNLVFEKANYYFSLAMLTLLSGLRYRLAPDTVAYMAQFRMDVLPLNAISLDYIVMAKYQPFWVLLNSFCKMFDNFTMLQIIAAWILNGSIFYFFRKTTTKKYTAISLYYVTSYFYFNMEIMRESLAVAMFLIAVVCYAEKRFFWFYTFLLFSVLFHKFAILVVALAPFALTDKVSSYVKIAFPIILIVFLQSLSSPLEYIGTISGFAEDLNLHFYDVDSEMTAAGLLYHLLRVIPIFMVMLFFKSKPIPDLIIDKKILYPLCWLFIFTVIVRIISIPFMDRISNYYIFFVICCMASVLANLLEHKTLQPMKSYIVVCSIFVSLLFYVLPLFVPDPHLDEIPTYRRYYPYSSVLFEESDYERERIIQLEAKE